MAEAASRLESKMPSMRVIEPAGKTKTDVRRQEGRKSRKGVKLGRRHVNKSWEIRQEAKKMVAAGKVPRPSDIVDALAVRKINVSSGQVTVALRGTGLSLREQKAQLDRLPLVMPDPRVAISNVTLDEVILARDFIGVMGSVQKAIAAITAFQGFATDGGSDGQRTDHSARHAV
jgi:hypothetical protein